MNIKKLVFILIGVTLISLGVGALSLNHYGCKLNNSNGVNIDLNGINVNDGNSSVKIGSGGVHVVDGDNNVKVGIGGIDIKNSNGNSAKVNDSNNSFFGKGISKKNIDEEKFENIEGIKNIDVETSFVDVNIIAEERENVRAHYSGYIKATYIPNLEIKKDKNTIYIKVKQDNLASHSVYNSNLKLDVYIPVGFKDNMSIQASSGNINGSDLEISNLKLTASSGDIEVHGLNLNDFYIETSSGNQIVEDTKLKKSKFIATSGDIKISNLNLEDLYIETSSGNQIIKDVKSKKSDFTATSGNINIYNFSNDANVNTSSGNIELYYENFNNNISANATSGNIEIKLPSDSKFNLNAKTSSGDIESNFPITTTGKQKNSLSGKVGNSTNTVDIKTSSGNISIRH